MTLSEVCIKRPVLATVFSLLLVVIGALGFQHLNTRFFPKHDNNHIIITTTYTGASAKLVENNITTPIEEAISSVEGIDSIRSNSRQGMSRIRLSLKPGFNSYEVSNKLRNKIAMANSRLPANIKSPIVQSGWGEMELMDVGFISKSENLNALRDYLDRYVINRIQQVPGVTYVEANGANQYSMQILLNPEKMAVRGLGIGDVETAIRNSNIQLPAGEIKDKSISYPITAETKLHDAIQFGNIIIKKLNDHIVRLNDIAEVKLGTDTSKQTIVHVNNQQGIVLTIFQGADANPIKTADKINKLLNDVKDQLPHHIKMIPSFNQAAYMKKSVHEVYQALFIAIICVALVIFLFLGRIRTVLIPLATIPICLIATFGLMSFLGFSINVITLLAIVLSIGLIVDDAIVMLENIQRHIESGIKPFLAAIKGSKEITFSIIAMTITLAAVYAPIGLMNNEAANIFKSFAFTLAGTVLISGFIALTLSPMMCARLLTAHTPNQKSYYNIIERGLNKLRFLYQRMLTRCLKIRFIIIIISLLIATGGYFIFTSLPKDFMPKEDEGFIIATVTVPSGTNANVTHGKIKKVTQIIRQYSEIK